MCGGASGLGKGTTRRLVAEGAKVVIANVNEARATEVAAEIGARGARCDVTDGDSVTAVVAQTAALSPQRLRISVFCRGILPIDDQSWRFYWPTPADWSSQAWFSDCLRFARYTRGIGRLR